MVFDNLLQPVGFLQMSYIALSLGNDWDFVIFYYLMYFDPVEHVIGSAGAASQMD